MYTKPVHLGADAGLQPILNDDVAINRGGIEWPIQLPSSIIRHRVKHRAIDISGMPGECQVLLNQTLGRHMHGNKADLVALALNPAMQHPLAALNIAHPEPAQFLTADAVIEQGVENGAIAGRPSRCLRTEH
jgi:hypothetical protein